MSSRGMNAKLGVLAVQSAMAVLLGTLASARVTEPLPASMSNHRFCFVIGSHHRCDAGTYGSSRCRSLERTHAHSRDKKKGTDDGNGEHGENCKPSNDPTMVPSDEEGVKTWTRDREKDRMIESE